MKTMTSENDNKKTDEIRKGEERKGKKSIKNINL